MWLLYSIAPGVIVESNGPDVNNSGGELVVPAPMELDLKLLLDVKLLNEAKAAYPLNAVVGASPLVMVCVTKLDNAEVGASPFVIVCVT